MAVSLTLKSEVGRPISSEEMDDNFTSLETQISNAPSFSDVVPFLTGEKCEFSLFNFESNGYYFSTLPLFVFDSNGDFEGFPLIDTDYYISCFTVGKKTSSYVVVNLEHHDQPYDSIIAFSYTNSSLSVDPNQDYLLLPVGSLLATADYELSTERSVFISGLDGTIELYTFYTENYIEVGSSVDELFFSEAMLFSDYITAYFGNGTYKEIYTVGNSFVVSPIPDIFGDGSCVDMWNMDSFPVLQNQIRATNTIDLTGSTHSQNTNGKYGNAVNWDISDTGEYISALGNVVATDTPITITMLISGNQNSNSYFGILYGEYGQRYNVELYIGTYTHYSNDKWTTDVNYEFYSHKRANYVYITHFHDHTAEEGDTFGFHVISLRRLTGKFEILFDSIYKGVSIDNIEWKFNASMGVTLSVYDGASGSGTTIVDHIRIFNRNLTTTEYGLLLSEEGQRITVSPSLPSVPTKISNGRLFNEVKFNSTIVAPVSAVLSDTTWLGHDAKWSITYPKHEEFIVPTISIKKYQNEITEERVYIKPRWTEPS